MEKISKIKLEKKDKKYLDQLKKNEINSINKISKQIICSNKGEKIKEDIIVAIPVFFKETKKDLKILMKELNKQIGNHKIILHINSFGKNTKSNIKIKEKKERLKKLCKENKKIIITSIHYTNRQKIGTIFADFIDAIVISCNLNKDPIIIRLDADTYCLYKGYFQNINNLFKNNKNISYCNSRLYYTKPNKHHFVRIAEIVSDLAGYRNSNDYTKVPSYGPSMAFKANERIKIQGCTRNMERMEDYVIAWKITQYYGSVEKPDYSRGMRSNEIVYCHPRRQIQNLLQGRYYHQNTYEFNFVEKNKLDFAKLEPYNIAVKKMINKVYTSLQELCLIEDYINRFSIDLRDIRLEFSEYWNKYVSEYSLYKAIVDNKGIHFIEKNFID